MGPVADAVAVAGACESAAMLKAARLVRPLATFLRHLPPFTCEPRAAKVLLSVAGLEPSAWVGLKVPYDGRAVQIVAPAVRWAAMIAEASQKMAMSGFL